MDETQHILTLVPGKLYLAICPLIFSDSRGGELKLNEVYLFMTSIEILSCFDDKVLPHREYHFLHNQTTVKPRLLSSSLPKYFVEI